MCLLSFMRIILQLFTSPGFWSRQTDGGITAGETQTSARQSPKYRARCGQSWTGVKNEI